MSHLIEYEIPNELSQCASNEWGYYLTLPMGLMGQIEDRRPEIQMTAQWNLDWQAADLVEAIEGFIGIRGNSLVPYQLFSFQETEKQDAGLRDYLENDLALSEQEIEATYEAMQVRYYPMRDARRAYCGWLVTQPTFVNEYQTFVETHSQQLTEYGFPNACIQLPLHPLSAHHTLTAEENMRTFLADYTDFCVRWRLSRFAGPMLPEPIAPMLATVPDSLKTPIQRSGSRTISIPDICPELPGNELRSIVREGRDRLTTDNEHLTDWFNLINGRDRNQMRSYRSLFDIYFCFRTLYARHNRMLRRKKRLVNESVGDLLSLSNDQVNRALTRLNQSTPNWLQQRLC